MIKLTCRNYINKKYTTNIDTELHLWLEDTSINLSICVITIHLRDFWEGITFTITINDKTFIYWPKC